ncbi:MAG: hypothetical protein ACLRZH_19260 [Ruthenibacterium lactatiformans]
MSGFTMGCNHALRSKELPLAAKGLYLVISSFCGMPGWRLSKSQLVQFCESRYALEKAWHNLLEAGYLKHRFSRWTERRICPYIRPADPRGFPSVPVCRTV